MLCCMSTFPFNVLGGRKESTETHAAYNIEHVLLWVSYWSSLFLQGFLDYFTFVKPYGFRRKKTNSIKCALAC